MRDIDLSEKLLLKRCESTWGEARIYSEDPGITRLSNAIYVPISDTTNWGIFDSGGDLVQEAVDFHGPNRSIGVQSFLETRGFEQPEVMNDDFYIYGGHLHAHYGHFLINTLSRLWFKSRRSFPVLKVLFHGASEVNTFLSHGFIREVFQAMGLNESNIVIPTKSSFIGQLIIPHVSLFEQCYVHRAYASLANYVGDRLVGAGDLEMSDTPIYMSKLALKAGVGRIVNEDEVVHRLVELGVEIIEPESLSLRQQILLFRKRKTVLASVGSSLHTSIFSRNCARLICFSPTEDPNSNYKLCDLANRTDARYYFTEGTVVVNSSEKFLTELKIKDPKRVAEELVDLALHAS